jgi:hypothetical protein
VEILAWLVPPAVVTVLAMIWAAWAGRPQRVEADRSDASAQRFAQAIAKPHPAAGKARPAVSRDRSTGIAVRPSRRSPQGGTGGGTGSETRRSA